MSSKDACILEIMIKDLKPLNILFLFPDQLRADFLSCYGADFIETPHIDSIARSGCRYDRALSPSPLCVPARASLLTGLNGIRLGVLDNSSWLRPDNGKLGIETWPGQLSEAGYFTSAIGKMHFSPWDGSEGFQHRIISEDKRHLYIQDDYYDYLEEQGLEKLHGRDHEGYYENKGAIISTIPEEHQVDRWVSDQAAEFIKGYSGKKPFALMVGFPGPHCPYDPPPYYADQFDPLLMPAAAGEKDYTRKLRDACIESCSKSWNGVDYADFNEQQIAKIRAHYAGLVKQIDDGVGRIIESLKEAGKFDNTLIIFSSDHGDLLGDFGMVGKANFMESSIRVPMLVSHPDMPGEINHNEPVSLTDINRTILRAAGIKSKDRNDSCVLPGLPFSEKVCRDYVFGCVFGDFMITRGKWKLARYSGGDVHLFNLGDDPLEQNNLADDPASFSVLKELDILMTLEIGLSLYDQQSPVMSWDRVITEQADTAASAFGKRGWSRKYPAYR